MADGVVAARGGSGQALSCGVVPGAAVAGGGGAGAAIIVLLMSLRIIDSLAYAE
jgi:hypothetical protein